jgi:tetratricopeptide (TPR) repeat protein
MHQVASAYRDLGRHAEALKLCEETLAGRAAKLGPDHPETLYSKELRAQLLFDSGRREEGLKSYEETLALYRAKMGPDNPQTLESVGGLVADYYAAGRFADALRHCQDALDLTKAKYGPDHTETMGWAGGVARCLVAVDRGAEALTFIDDWLKRATPRVSPSALSEMWYLRQEHFAKAKDVAGCRATVELAEKPNPSDWSSLYGLACMRAVTAAVIRATDKTETAARAASTEADRAMAWLKQAIAAGDSDVQNMKTTKVLDSLRDRTDFQRLLADLGASNQKEKK